MALSSQVSVSFGDPALCYGEVLNIEAPSLQQQHTAIKVLVPAYPIARDPVNVPVTITPIQQTNLAVVGEFSYFYAQQTLVSVRPSTVPAEVQLMAFGCACSGL